MTLPAAAALCVAVVATVSDIRTHRVPNRLTLGAALAGLLYHGTVTGQLADSAGGWLAGLLVFLPVFLLGALGGGDVKLVAALGAWLGIGPVLKAAAYGAVAGGVLALVVAWRHRLLGSTLRNIAGLLQYWRLAGVQPLPALTLADGRGPRLPYALPVLCGVLLTAWSA